MKEETLITTAFIIAVIGLCALFMYSENFKLDTIQDLEQINPEEKVKIKGKINKLRDTKNAIFIEIEGERVIKTDIILFPEKNVSLKEGDYVEIYGEVDEYNNEKEVIASKVILK